METKNYFKTLALIDRNKLITNKKEMNWAKVWREVKNFDPNASFKITKTHTEDFKDVPYIMTDMGIFVEATVVIENISLSAIVALEMEESFPYTKKPSAVAIVEAQWEALMLACALHGVGIDYYCDMSTPKVDQVDFKSLRDPNEDEKENFILLIRDLRARVEKYKFNNDIIESSLISPKQEKTVKTIIKHKGFNPDFMKDEIKTWDYFMADGFIKEANNLKSKYE